MTQHIHSTIADNREEGGRLTRSLIAQHLKTHDWHTLEQEEEAWVESYCCAWEKLVAPYTQAIDTWMDKCAGYEALLYRLGIDPESGEETIPEES